MHDLTAERAAIIGNHYECEDPWYSCPLAEDGCTNEAWDKTKCNCGLDGRNRALDKALKTARQEALREACKLVSDYNCMHDHGKKATKACDDIVEMLDRLASEGG